MSPLTAEDVRSAAFDKPPWGKRGYDEDEVDAFLQLAALRLEGRGQLSAGDVRSATFDKPPWGKRGYNEDQVDAFLEVLEATIAGLDARS